MFLYRMLRWEEHQSVKLAAFVSLWVQIPPGTLFDTSACSKAGDGNSKFLWIGSIPVGCVQMANAGSSSAHRVERYSFKWDV